MSTRVCLSFSANNVLNVLITRRERNVLDVDRVGAETLTRSVYIRRNETESAYLVSTVRYLKGRGIFSKIDNRTIPLFSF